MFTNVVGIQGHLPKLPNGYWNILEMEDLEIIYPKIQRITSHSHSEKKDRLLLVTGEPGCGKTNLMLQFARRMMRRPLEQGNDKGTAVITYFFNHGNTIEDCISSVVWQLKRLAEPTPDMMIGTLCCEIEKKFRSIYIVIDGLDDCFNPDDDETAPKLESLLELTFNTIELSEEIHWIISRRSFDKALVPSTIKSYELNLNDEKELEIDPENELEKKLEIEPETGLEKELGKPAMNLISIQLDAFFRRNSIQDSFRQKVETALLKKSKENLLWIKLACNILEKDPNIALGFGDTLEARVENLLDTFGEQIEDLYTCGYEQLKLTAKEEPYFEKIITTMIAAYQPLSISELRCLAPLPAGVNLKRLITKRFIFFLEVREDIVYFNHRLSKEFLLKRYDHNDQVTQQRHAEIAFQCLKTLVSRDSETNASKNISYFDTSHWVKHLLSSKFVSNDINIGLDAALMDFLNRGFTRWLSAMSKTKHPFSRANRHLLRLRDYLTVSYKSQSPSAILILPSLIAFWGKGECP